jgi:hypothetical protein
MNGLGEMHSYSGMTGMHSSTKNDSCLPQNPCKKAAEAGELLQSQENTHCGYNSILSVRNDGLMQFVMSRESTVYYTKKTYYRNKRRFTYFLAHPRIR